VIETARAALALSEIYAKTSGASASAAPASVKRLPKLEEADRTKALAALNQGALFLVSKSKNGLFEGPSGRAQRRPDRHGRGRAGLRAGAAPAGGADRARPGDHLAGLAAEARRLDPRRRAGQLHHLGGRVARWRAWASPSTRP
jgi:hypothetical protein